MIIYLVLSITHISAFALMYYVAQWRGSSPVEVICVVPVQLVPGVSGGVASLTRRLDSVLSHRPVLRARPLLPLHVIRWRLPEAVVLVGGAGGAGGGPAALVATLRDLAFAVLSGKTVGHQDTGVL